MCKPHGKMGWFFGNLRDEEEYMGVLGGYATQPAQHPLFLPNTPIPKNPMGCFQRADYTLIRKPLIKKRRRGTGQIDRARFFPYRYVFTLDQMTLGATFGFLHTKIEEEPTGESYRGGTLPFSSHLSKKTDILFVWVVTMSMTSQEYPPGPQR